MTADYRKYVKKQSLSMSLLHFVGFSMNVVLRCSYVLFLVMLLVCLIPSIIRSSESISFWLKNLEVTALVDRDSQKTVLVFDGSEEGSAADSSRALILRSVVTPETVRFYHPNVQQMGTQPIFLVSQPVSMVDGHGIRKDFEFEIILELVSKEDRKHKWAVISFDWQNSE